MATKKQIQAWSKIIAKRQKAVAAERAKLDDAIDQLQGLHDTCERALDAMQEALDALSELA